MKQDIIKQFRKVPGLEMSDDGQMTRMPLSSENHKEPGQLITVFPGDGILFNMIDIKSSTIPGFVEDPIGETKELKINYCASGRCELKLKTGECTYLAAGEIAMDAGQALNTYFYPLGEYRGFEVIVSMEHTGDRRILGERLAVPGMLYDACAVNDRPWIRNAGKFLTGFYEVFSYYIGEGFGADLIYVKCVELLMYLSKLDFEQAQLKRTYYTASQVEIAKKTKEILTSDLTRRFTARELAGQFGVSETSLKNYFRSVFGCGYAEYQQTLRMRTAAALLRDTDEKIAAIAGAVGFATQAKFGAAFKECYGVTPLEYRRQGKLNMLQEGGDRR